MRHLRPPAGAETITTFHQYNTHVNAFFDGKYQLLMVIGRPGLAKSRVFEEKLGTASHLIRGWAAPMQVYIEMFRHRDQLLVFDDAETLWKRPGGRVLLRSLCEHKPRKLIQWTSTTRELAKAGVPQEFTTSSKVAIVANRFVFGEGDESDAVMDRGHLILFDPSPLEVHQQVGDWFWDQEIYDFVGERLHLFERISARLYLKAWERKGAAGNWRKLIEVTYCRDRTTRIVAALEKDPNCRTVEDRVKKFIDETGACRATYYNLKRELRKSDRLPTFEKFDVPARRLSGKPPIEPNTEKDEARSQEGGDDPHVQED